MATDWTNQQPPTATKAEHALLGACLIAQQAITDALATGLRPHHFYSPHLAALYQAMLQHYADGEPVDLVTIQPTAAKLHPHWRNTQSQNELIDIQASCPVFGHAPQYARKIIETANKRAAHNTAIQAAQNPHKAPEILADYTQLDSTPAKQQPTPHTAPDGWSALAKPVEWIIPDWMPAAEILHLSATGGSGKSRLMLQTAASMALGEQWLPLHHQHEPHQTTPKSSLKQASVWYATWEDSIATFARRLTEMKYEQTHPNLTITQETDILWAAEDTDTKGTPTDRLKQILHTTETQGIDILIIDPIVAAYGANENNRQQTREFLGYLTEHIRRTGLTIIIVSHTSKAVDSIYSGCTDWYNAPRAFWSMRTETWEVEGEKSKGTRLRLEKSSHGKPHPATDDLWLRDYPIWQHTSQEGAAYFNMRQQGNTTEQPPSTEIVF